MAKDDNKRESAKTADPPDLDVAAEPTVEFVKVQKDAETLHVHPSALADHVKQGWKVAE